MNGRPRQVFVEHRYQFPDDNTFNRMLCSTITRRRKKMGKTQAWLADKLGISRSLMGHLERGKRYWKGIYLLKAEALLSLNTQDFLEDLRINT